MNKLLILGLLVLVSGFYASDSYAQSSTVSFDSPKGYLYYTTDSILFQAESSPPAPPNSDVTLYIWTDENLRENYYLTTNSAGSLSYIWYYYDLDPGVYPVEVVFADGATGQQTFEVTSSSSSNQIDFQLDKDTYILGDTINIQGTLTPSVSGQELMFRIITPENKYITGTGVSGPDSSSFDIEKSIATTNFVDWSETRGENPEGTYTMIATYGDQLELVTFEMVKELPSPIIHPSSPCDDGCTHEGNNPDLKIFASGYIENPIDGLNTISSVWKDSDGIVVYNKVLQVDSQGQFNNEFDNPMYVRDMNDSGLYTTTYTYSDVVLEYTWNYLSSVYEPEPTDNIPPVVVVPNNMAIETTSNNPSPVTFSVSASDDKDGPITPACTHASGSNFPIGTTSVTCTATDDAGNQSSESFTITVTYDEPEPTYDEFTVIVEEGVDVPGLGPTLQINVYNAAQTVSINISSTGGELIDSLEFVASSSGEVNQPWVIPSSTESGMYTVSARDAFNSDCIKFDLDTFVTDENCSVYSPEPEPDNEPDFQPQVTIIPTAGSGAPGCEETPVGCFIPETAFVAIDGLVIFSNTDTAAHTFTAGGENGNTGEFDTGLLMAGGTFEYVAEEAGEIEYYCMVHPWMVGILVVGGDSVDTPDTTLPMDISARTNTSSYDTGDNLTITGQILNYEDAGHVLQFTITSPDNDIVMIGQIGTPNSDGSFSYSFDVGGPLYKTTGTYFIKIYYGPLSETISFTYHGEYEEPETETEIESLSTRKTQYRTGDTIVISGKVKTTDFNIPVTLQVINEGSLVDISQIQISSDQTFTHTILAEGPLWSESGKYSIKATFGNDVEDTSFVFRTDDRTYPEPEPADDEVTIVPADGSGAPGCEETADGCYIPRIVSVSKYGTVIMKNTDTAAHTFTAGTPDEGPTGEFDTSLLMAGGSFEWSPDSEGIYPYFCMVHPWMIGTILVGEGTLPPPSPEPEPEDHVDLEIEIEGRLFDINTVVEMYVALSGNSESQNVAIDITDPRGTTIISRSIEVGPNDSDFFEFKIDENFKQGNYKVTATTSDGNRTEKDTAHFM